MGNADTIECTNCGSLTFMDLTQTTPCTRCGAQRTVYKRKVDGKTFLVTHAGHWSDIVAADGETDSVKLYGFTTHADLFVSANKGFSYERPHKCRKGV